MTQVTQFVEGRRKTSVWRASIPNEIAADGSGGGPEALFLPKSAYFSLALARLIGLRRQKEFFLLAADISDNDC
jgi:hypothetical protein